MIVGARRNIQIVTERLVLRLPEHKDYLVWRQVREQSEAFLKPWEPTWVRDGLSRRAFSNRVAWAQKSVSSGTALPLFLVKPDSCEIVGGLTLDNIRRGPSQTASVGYWMGEAFSRQGYMLEALNAVVHHAFTKLDLSRIEAGCLPENAASRGLLERCGFKYEGVAQAYLQINGRWRNHVLYANLRADRRGKTDVR